MNFSKPIISYGKLVAIVFFGIGMQACAAPAKQREKPILYDHVSDVKAPGKSEHETRGDTPLDKFIDKKYGDHYTLLEIHDIEGTYVEPNLKKGEYPKPVHDVAGNPVEGYVLVGYIITPEGAVAEPVIVTSTDKRLDEAVLTSIKAAQFDSAKWNGKNITTAAAQEFNFGAKGVEGPRKFGDSIMLYQPDEALRARGPDVTALTEFMKAIGKVCTDYFVGHITPESLDVVVAIKPGGQSRFWFVSSRADAADSEYQPLRNQLSKLPVPEVRGGPVAFALRGGIAGGRSKAAKGANDLPIPKEWRESFEQHKPEHPLPDSPLDILWPDQPLTASKVDQPTKAPYTGYVTQVLEPTGGKIPRPESWFYSEQHTAHSYVWVVSMEDAAHASGRYTTGVKIQLLSGIKKGTGKSPREFVLDFIAKKKQSVAIVLKSCPEKNQGLFTRVCLETEEGGDHIQYSLFWGEGDMDMVVVTIAGTTKELWDTFSPTFEKMSELELIDMKRFEK